MKNKKYLIFGILTLLVISIVYSQIVTDEIDTKLDFKERDLNFQTNKDGAIKINTLNSKDIYIGFAISGKVNNQAHLVTIEDYNWTWTKESYNVTRKRFNQTASNETYQQIDNLTITITNLTATNNNSLLIWKQQYTFDPERNPKLSHTITNNIGRDITNATFWFVFKLPENFKLKFGGDNFIINNSNIRIRNTEQLNLTRILPIIDLEEIEFRYADLLNNNFVVGDFYVGNGSIVGYPETLIGAIGVTKGNSILRNGQTIILDPEITAYKSPTRTGSFYAQWLNSDNIRVSDNAYASVTTHVTYPRISSDLYGFDSIPADATINGIEIRVEGLIDSPGCIV